MADIALTTITMTVVDIKVVGYELTRIAALAQEDGSEDQRMDWETR